MKPELDPYATPERRKAAKEKVAHLQQSYAKIQLEFSELVILANGFYVPKI